MEEVEPIGMSLHSIVGITNPKTMKLLGKIGLNELGNGEEIVRHGICRRVELEIQGLTIIQDYLSLELGNSDLILGVQWLETLGSVTTNWKTQTMQMFGKGKKLC